MHTFIFSQDTFCLALRLLTFINISKLLKAVYIYGLHIVIGDLFLYKSEARSISVKFEACE